MKTRILSLLVALVLAVSMLVSLHAPAAQAVSKCATTGTLGTPKIVNKGGSNSYINVWSSSGVKHSVYVNHPQYFCPAYVWVTAGRTVYIWCNQANPIFWYSRRIWDPLHGKRKLATYCSGFHSGTFKISENKN